MARAQGAGRPTARKPAGGFVTQGWQPSSSGPGTGPPGREGVDSGWPPVTHTDVQVLQEEPQQARAQAQRPRALVAARGLDPRAQVLGKKGPSHTGPRGGRPRGPRTTGRSASLPGRPPPFGAWQGLVRAGHRYSSPPPRLCPAGLATRMATPRGPRASWACEGMGWPPPAHPAVSVVPDSQKLTPGAPAAFLHPGGMRRKGQGTGSRPHLGQGLPPRAHLPADPTALQEAPKGRCAAPRRGGH